MMYNRYIPSSNGTYKRQSIHIPDHENTPHHTDQNKKDHEKTNESRKQPQHQNNFDLGDLLLLCIVVLLLLDTDEEDALPIILVIAAFMFLQ